MMRYDSPLRNRHQLWLDERAAPDPAEVSRPGAATGTSIARGVTYIDYGPPDESGAVLCEIPGVFDLAEIEYAAIRRAAGLMDGPQRATVRVRGGERRDFLNRMITQELADLDTGVRTAFWLNRKGRVEADLLLAEFGDEMLIDVDVHQAETMIRTLDEFLFGEDVQFECDESTYRISVHGASAVETIGQAAGTTLELPDRSVGLVSIAGASVRLARRDQVGDPGVELFLPRTAVEPVWSALLAAGAGRVRPIGWFAYNIARIEAGTPLMNVDFGATNLPHETGVLRDRVSFTKGCYLGQEIVARMESLGRPKQSLVGLRLEGDRLPAAGAHVVAAEGGPMDEPVGVVTSSTHSPMRSAAPIAFAMIRAKCSAPETALGVVADGQVLAGTVSALRFWSRADA
jgi:folate-binding protein YgfZ